MSRVKLHLRKSEYLEILVQPGYVEIQRRYKGKLYGVITLPRNKARTLLKWLIPQVNGMPNDADPLAYLDSEAVTADEVRRQRREARRSPRRRHRTSRRAK